MVIHQFMTVINVVTSSLLQSSSNKSSTARTNAFKSTSVSIESVITVNRPTTCCNETQLVLACSGHLGVVIIIEYVPLQVCKVDDFRAGLASPCA